MKETAGMNYVDLKCAVLMVSSGRVLRMAVDIEHWGVTVVRWRGIVKLCWNLGDDFWRFSGEM